MRLAAFLTVVLAAGVVSAQGTAEYVDQTQGHQVGVSAAHRYRPNDKDFLATYRKAAEEKIRAAQPSLSPDSPEFQTAVDEELKPIIGLADGLMQDMVCLCGGCGRETLHECKCGYAANERKEMLEILSRFDLSQAAQRDEAREAVIAAFIEKHQGEHVLGATRNPFAWLVPYLFAGGALILLYAMGRRWVARGRKNEDDTTGFAVDAEEDQDYADRLDDELRETD